MFKDLSVVNGRFYKFCIPINGVCVPIGWYMKFHCGKHNESVKEEYRNGFVLAQNLLDIVNAPSYISTKEASSDKYIVTEKLEPYEMAGRITMNTEGLSPEQKSAKLSQTKEEIIDETTKSLEDIINKTANNITGSDKLIINNYEKIRIDQIIEYDTVMKILTNEVSELARIKEAGEEHLYTYVHGRHSISKEYCWRLPVLFEDKYSGIKQNDVMYVVSRDGHIDKMEVTRIRQSTVLENHSLVVGDSEFKADSNINLCNMILADWIHDGWLPTGITNSKEIATEFNVSDDALKSCDDIKAALRYMQNDRYKTLRTGEQHRLLDITEFALKELEKRFNHAAKILA